jgi:hypothetical protein
MSELGIVTTEIDTPYLDRLRSFLEGHGAVVTVLLTQSYMAYPNGMEEQRESNTCEITFPPGTTREMDRKRFRLPYSEPIVFRFPDGAELRGTNLLPLNNAQQPRLLLDVPDAEEKKENINSD